MKATLTAREKAFWALQPPQASLSCSSQAHCNHHGPHTTTHIHTLTTSLFCYPMDTVKKRLQGQNFGSMVKLYSGPLDCGLKIIRDEGYRTLYRGVAPTLVKR